MSEHKDKVRKEVTNDINEHLNMLLKIDWSKSETFQLVFIEKRLFKILQEVTEE